MTKTMTNDEMVALMARHDNFEAEGDVEGTMSTVSQNPCWELYPIGYVITGREAITEFYRRVLPSVRNIVTGLKKKNFWFDADNDGYAVEFEIDMVDADGAPFVSRIITTFEFEDGLVRAERGFLGPQHGAIMKAILGPDFLDVPGVSLAR